MRSTWVWPGNTNTMVERNVAGLLFWLMHGVEYKRNNVYSPVSAFRCLSWYLRGHVLVPVSCPVDV